MVKSYNFLKMINSCKKNFPTDYQIDRLTDYMLGVRHLQGGAHLTFCKKISYRLSNGQITRLPRLNGANHTKTNIVDAIMRIAP